MKLTVAFRNFAKAPKNIEKETLSWATNGNFFQFLVLPFTQLYLLSRFYSISCLCVHGLAMYSHITRLSQHALVAVPVYP